MPLLQSEYIAAPMLKEVKRCIFLGYYTVTKTGSSLLKVIKGNECKKTIHTQCQKTNGSCDQ